MDERRYYGQKRAPAGKEDRNAGDGKKVRKKIAGRRRKRNIISFLFIIVLICAALLIFARTPLFHVESIDIKGNSRVSGEDILRFAGIKQGDNIFDRSKKGIEERIFTMPYISEVSVVKKYPSKIVITVKEADEFAALAFGDSVITCDRSGKSIRVVSEDAAKELILFENLKQGEFSPGEFVVLEDEEQTKLFRNCLEIIDKYEFNDVREVRMSDKYNVDLVLSANLTVKLGELGSEDEIAYKISYVKEVIDSMPKGVSGTIDARNPEVGVFHSPGDGTHDAVINTEEEEEELSEVENAGEADEEISEENSE